MKVQMKMTQIQALIKLFGFYNYIQPKSNNVLTPSEMELLAVFCNLPAKYKHSMFSIQGKRKATENYLELFGKKLSNVNLNNKVYCLLDKEFLYRDEDKVIYLKPFLRKALDDLIDTQKLELNVTIDVETS